MTATTRDTFTIYNDQFTAGVQERMSQNINAFNGASNGAITLGSNLLQGDYIKRRFRNMLTSSSINRRLPSSVSGVSLVDVTQAEMVDVILHRRIGPLAKTLDGWRSINEDPAVLSLLIGQDVGELKSQEMLNTALKALKAAITGTGSTAYLDTVASTGYTHTMESAHLARALAMFGDAANRISMFVMHSKPYFDLIQSQISDKIVNVADVVIYGGSPATFNRPILVTDSAALVTTASGVATKYSTLALTIDAARVVENSASDVVSNVTLQLANLLGVIQGEYSYSLGIRGATWDVTNGGANPTDAALATSTNWDKIVASIKDTCGAMIISN